MSSLNNISDLVPIRDLRLPTNPSLQTMNSWWRDGVNGVFLKTYKLGGVRCTTHEDLISFVQQIGEDSTV